MPPSAFIGMLAGFAQDCQRRTGIPASITLAQAALESSWGARAPGNNLFGIKADKSWTGPTVTFQTTEHLAGQIVKMPDAFRRYDSWLASMIDHAQFLLKNPRYRDCFKQIDGAGWARALQAAGYATDPEYANKLIAIMRVRNLAFYDQVKP
ncbi:glycoside hydrolase family 73 protein [Massilia phyllosphaerae]|uniref:glycoside hydrolase family 73 protein n=1 Tax=Massilia phyllosphaerae TaxID=3106034 RepID=UPI002B1CE04E|nr:glycoside hydrolase family 73 protein [Massilia sp. SGZ-792]